MSVPSRRDLYGGADVKRTKKSHKVDGMTRKGWIREADKYASLCVRGVIDGHTVNECVLMGLRIGGNIHVCSGKLECGHLFTRMAYSTRWDEANLYPVCSWVNTQMENDPVVAEALLEYARSVWGPDFIAQLHRTYEQAVPMKTHEIAELARWWRDRYVRFVGEVK